MILRCHAPRKNAPGVKCGAYVTRTPVGYRFEFVSLVGHDSLADPRNDVFACTSCGMLHEIRRRVDAKALRKAA